MEELFRCYILLGVKPGASVEEIKRAYRRMAGECHPDRVADATARRRAEDRLRALNEAYAALKEVARSGATHGTRPAAPGYDPLGWRESVAQQGTGAEQTEEAEAFYARAAQLHFDGLQAFRAARWHEAVSCLNQTVCMVRNNPEAFLTLSRAYRMLGLPAKAEAALREAARIDPDGVDAHAEIADLEKRMPTA